MTTPTENTDDRYAILGAALPGSLRASLTAAQAAIARGESEADALRAASDAAANAYEYWCINGEWPTAEELIRMR